MSKIIDDEIISQVLFNCVELFDFDDFDLSDPDFVEALAKVEKLMIKVPKGKNLSAESIAQLNLLLKQMTGLEILDINNSRGQMIDATSIFDSIPPSVERVLLKNLSFSQDMNQDSINNLSDLTYLRFEDSILSNLPILPNEKGLVFVDEKATIPMDQLIEYGVHHKLSTSIDEVRCVISALRSGTPVPLELYEKYNTFFAESDRDICIQIDNVGALDLQKLEELKNNSRIKSIYIEGGCYSHEMDNELTVYSLEEYASVRAEIDKIVSQVEIPDSDDKDREKKIFAQVYRILGEKISYDHYAISEEGKKDTELAHNCRNLKNGLLGIERNGQIENLAVCAGYADILRNVLSCFNIEAQYISSKSEVELKFENGAYVDKTDENGKLVYRNGTNDPMGHAYNFVVLDGESYYADLTWDASYIKSKRFPMPNFLKSSAEFEQSHEDVGFNSQYKPKAFGTFPPEKQFELFGAGVAPELSKMQSMIDEGYLSGFVAEYLGAVKGGRENITPEELISAMEFIKRIEDHILARENSFSNIAVGLGDDKKFVFETSNPEKLKKMKREIKKRREREEDSFGEF